MLREQRFPSEKRGAKSGQNDPIKEKAGTKIRNKKCQTLTENGCPSCGVAKCNIRPLWGGKVIQGVIKPREKVWNEEIDGGEKMWYHL